MSMTSIMCSRTRTGRYVVVSDEGDRFEFMLAIKRGAAFIRMVGPPHWRIGMWPSDAAAIAEAARKTATARARFDGFAV